MTKIKSVNVNGDDKNTNKKTSFCSCIYCIKCSLLSLGSITLGLGIIFAVSWRTAYEHLLSKELQLSEGSSVFRAWVDSTSTPVNMSLYLFQWANPVESASMKEKPRFEEVGPFICQIVQRKYDFIWNSTDGSLTYKTNKTTECSDLTPKASLNEKIATVNLIPLIAANAEHLSEEEKALLENAMDLGEQPLHITKTAGEIISDIFGNQVSSGPIDKLIDSITKRFKSKLDIFSIDSGMLDLNNMGNLFSWNNKKRCRVYTDECDEVSGSVGDIWPLNIGYQKNATLFVPELCGKLTLTNVGEETVNDLKATRFEGLADVFQNDVENEKNQCYCSGSCNYASGVRSIEKCLDFALPTYVSYPHFYLASSSYTTSIEGMKPDKHQHAFSMTLLKDIGIPVEMKARLQVNLLVQPPTPLPFMPALKLYAPIAWFDFTIRLPSSVTDKVKFIFYTVPHVLSYCGFGLVVTGFVLLIVGLIWAKVCSRNVPQKNDKL